MTKKYTATELAELLDGIWRLTPEQCKQASAMLRAMEWQDISTAPKDGTGILITGGERIVTDSSGIECYRGDLGESVVLVRYKDSCCEDDFVFWSINYDNEDNWYKPTRWQPLPQPPKESE